MLSNKPIPHKMFANRSHLIIAAVLFAAALPCAAQQHQDIFKRELWNAQGEHQNQQFGSAGLDTIGYLNDTIPDAIAVSSDGRSRLIFNRFPGDTTAQYIFPGQKVIRGNINGDSFPDYVVWSASARKITVLFGTRNIVEFDTALVIQGNENNNSLGDVRMLVADCDQDGYDDLIISDYVYEENNITTGRLLWYRGSPKMDSLPAEILSSATDHVGTALGVGKVRDTVSRYLIERRGAVAMYLRRFGAEFHLSQSDTVIYTIDPSRYCCISNGFAVMDCDGDGMDEILIMGYDTAYANSPRTDPVIFAYKGGSSSLEPAYYFHSPYATGSTTFGTQIVDLGDITGRGYHTIAVTDPQASEGGIQNGAVFLFNTGKALKDSCVAYGVGPGGFENYFGSQVIPLSNVTGDGRNGFMVSSDAENFTTQDIHIGEIYVFVGDTSYGPVVGVHETNEIAGDFVLQQNYPNPCTDRTEISFKSISGEATLTLYDMLGREIKLLYHGRSDSVGRILELNTESLIAGTYIYRLIAGNKQQRRILNVIK